MTDSPQVLRARRRVALAIIILLAIVLTAAWTSRTWTARATLDHPVFALLEEQGWELTHDRRYRAGLLERTLMGGMIQNPVQREVHFEVEEERLGVLQVEVERILFGEAGLQDPMEAHGLNWDRTTSTRSASYTGHPPDPESTRLERIHIQIGPGAVHIRSFGH